MTANASQRARSVFVGNIHFDADENELRRIFREAGPVLSFKVMKDRETGKPRGYGFCEYGDRDTALRAIQTLNGYDLHGRTLRVDYAEKGGDDDGAHGNVNMNSNMGAGGGNNNVGSGAGPAQGIPMKPEDDRDLAKMRGFGRGPLDAMHFDSAEAHIDYAVGEMTPVQGIDIVEAMKRMIAESPEEARRLLAHNPQLCHALVKVQIVLATLTKLDARDFTTIAGTPIHKLDAYLSPTHHQQPPQQQHRHPQQQNHQHHPQQQQQHYQYQQQQQQQQQYHQYHDQDRQHHAQQQHPPMGRHPMQHDGMQQQHGHHHHHHHHQQHHQQQGFNQDQGHGQPPQQVAQNPEAMLQLVMNLSPDQLAALPQEQRIEIERLKAQLVQQQRSVR